MSDRIQITRQEAPASRMSASNNSTSAVRVAVATLLRASQAGLSHDRLSFLGARPAMTTFFFYGTLLDHDVMAVVIGRRLLGAPQILLD